MGGLAAASVNVVMAGSWADATKISVDVERLGRWTMARPYDSVALSSRWTPAPAATGHLTMTAPELRLFDFHRTFGRWTSSHRAGRAVYSASLKGRPRGVTVSAESQPLAIDVRGIRRVYAAKPAAGRRPRRRRPAGRAGRVLRAARTQRRRQDHADQDPDDAAAAVRGHRPHLRLRRRRPDQADPPDHEHGRRRRAVGLRDPDRPRAALDVQPVLRPAARRTAGAASTS